MLEYQDGDIIDIHQTVNGCSQFVILDLEKQDVRYFIDNKIGHRYEYSVDELLYQDPEFSETEVIGNIHDTKYIGL